MNNSSLGSVFDHASRGVSHMTRHGLHAAWHPTLFQADSEVYKTVYDTTDGEYVVHFFFFFTLVLKGRESLRHPRAFHMQEALEPESVEQQIHDGRVTLEFYRANLVVERAKQKQGHLRVQHASDGVTVPFGPLPFVTVGCTHPPTL